MHVIPVNALYLSIDCPFQDVVKIFQQSPCSNIVAKNWRSLARSFKTSQILVDQQNQKLLLTTLTEFDVIQDMLIDWRNRKSKKSTLGELIWIVEDELKWNQIASNLHKLIKHNNRTFFMLLCLSFYFDKSVTKKYHQRQSEMLE